VQKGLWITMGQAAQPTPPVVVTGASGRIGRVLQVVWGGLRPAGFAVPDRVWWTARQAGQPVWHIGGPVPVLPQGAIVLHLAAALHGPEVASNAATTDAVCRAAIACGASHVFVASTAAVYPSGRDLAETVPPAPTSAYGRSKHESEQAAMRLLPGPMGPGLTVLRIGNLAGADSLLGGLQPGTPALLDPIPDQPGGPLRSYIGPSVLAGVLAALILRAQAGGDLPQILNVAQPGVVAMGDLLDAAGHPWRFGPRNPAAIPVVGLSVDRLQAVLPADTLPPATAAGILADLTSIKEQWR